VRDPSQAATGSWSGSVAAPVIRQTNTDYTSGTIPPGTQPSATVITGTSWFSSYPSTPAGHTFAIKHCNTSACSSTSPFNSGSNTSLAGFPSLQPFYFVVRVNYSTTHVLTSPMSSGALQLTVNYSY
jgi:hypothetical protein